MTIDLAFWYITPTFPHISIGLGAALRTISLPTDFFQGKKIGEVRQVTSFNHRNSNQSSFPIHISIYFNTQYKSKSIRLSEEWVFLLARQIFQKLGAVRQVKSINNRDDNQSSFPINMPNYFSTQHNSWSHNFSKQEALLTKFDCEEKLGGHRQKYLLWNTDDDNFFFPIHLINQEKYNQQVIAQKFWPLCPLSSQAMPSARNDVTNLWEKRVSRTIHC